MNLVVKETSRSYAWITWDAPLIDGGSPVKSYVVEKRLAERKAWTCVAAETPKTSFRILNLEAGEAYCFRVLAENAYGIGEGCETTGSVRASGTSCSSPSFRYLLQEIFSNTNALPILFISEQPGPVTDFKAHRTTKNSITLGWKKPISDGGSYVTAYILELNESEDKWMQVKKGKETSHTMADLTEGKEYCFRVKALNESGEGPPTELTVIAKDQFGKYCWQHSTCGCGNTLEEGQRFSYQ